ncbi:MAG TPA: hypothetical protein VK083_22150 [Nocardia sp.]|uniref:hypothetical protein n=1 Tax=Nocardia sp. TaxID=1821 RepID=UPI002B4AD61A|nr:hypothetical protein [Nocardia sp.]HLS79492.1 hypothetical protein [Nocardia sp.]
MQNLVGQRFRLDDGRTVRLGAQLARAGEGTVTEVAGHPEWVAKIYHAHLPKQGLDARAGKVRAMAAAKPAGARQPDGFVVLAWPEHALLGPDNRVRGFVMRRIDTSKTVEVHSLSNPSDRADPNPKGPQWPRAITWLHLVNIARNLCRAVDSAHKAGAVIGDFNERNILVTNTTLVTLVDCDSFQFRSGTTVYPCGVARPEFLAPELAKADLAGHIRDKSSDLFVLAIHIYLLLMAGNHPFSRGNWTGPGEQPEALELAAGGHWAGGVNSKLKQHKAAPPVSMLSPAVRELFERALGVGATRPSRRPSAAEWQRALAAMTLVTCARDSSHVYADHNRSCPWCALATRQKGTVTGAVTRPRATTTRTGTRGTRAATATAATATRPAAKTTARTTGARTTAATTAARTRTTTARTTGPTTSLLGQVLAARTELDGRILSYAFWTSVTVLVPWLIGRFLLRGRFLPVSEQVYDGDIRPWWPYFWAELLGGCALIWLLAAVALVLRPWGGRASAVVAGAALFAGAVWAGPSARTAFAAAEAESVAALDADRYPLERYHPVCGSISAGERAAKGAPVHSRWQLFVYTSEPGSGQICDRVALYHGWREVDVRSLPADLDLGDVAGNMAVRFQESGESHAESVNFWGYDPAGVWLEAHATDGRTVTTNLGAEARLRLR